MNLEERAHFTGCGDFARFLSGVFFAGSLGFRFFIGEQPMRQAARETARYAGPGRLANGWTRRRLLKIGLAFFGFHLVYGDDGRRHWSRAILGERLARENDIVVRHRRHGGAGRTVVGAAIAAAIVTTAIFKTTA